MDKLYTQTLSKAAATLAQLETSLFRLERFRSGKSCLQRQNDPTLKSQPSSSDDDSEMSDHDLPLAAGPLSLFNIRSPAISRVDKGVADFVNTATAVHEGQLIFTLNEVI